MTSVLIGSSVASLTLSRESGSVRAALDVPGLHAEAEVEPDHVSGWADLVEFFESLLMDWRGWEGTRAWRSVDNVLQIYATWGVELTVRLCPLPSVVQDQDWTVQASIFVEPGEQLRDVVAALRDMTHRWSTA